MEPSIFTRIIRGEIPCHKVYEDDRTIAFMDIRPLTEGHVVVTTKTQVDDFEKLPDEDYQALFTAVKKVAAKAKEVFGVRKAVITVEGFEVPHAHVHVLPCESADGFYTALEQRDERPTEPDHEALAKLAERLSLL